MVYPTLYNKRGFSLVELLVVIAIVAVLVSILLPALHKAHEQAKLTLCKMNLKQQALACLMYMEDHNDTFPSMWHPGSDDQAVHSALTYQSYGGKVGDLNNATTEDERLLNPYIGITGQVKVHSKEAALTVFRCPSDKGAYGGFWGEVTGEDGRREGLWKSDGFSYHYNSAALNNSGELGLWNKKSTSIKRPARVILIGDWTIATYFLNTDPFYYLYWHNKDELGWANTVFVDTHVAYLQITKDQPDFQHGKDWTAVYSD